jgi:cell division protein FtsQ
VGGEMSPFERPKPPRAPLADLPLRHEEEPPFLRSRTRTRARRTRRGLTARMVLALQIAGGLLVGLLLAWSGYSKVMASEQLRVGRIDVRGSHFLSEGEVQELLEPALGANILEVDIDELKKRLRASPWVADAVVTRALPDTLTVEIRERVPLALAELEQLYLMDEEGTLIDIYGPRTAGFDLPIVRGLTGIDGEARRDRARRAGTLLADLGELGAEVSEVLVEDSGELRLVLRGPGEIVRLGAPPYRERFTTFLALRRELAERCPDAEYFDLRFRDRIYAKRPSTATTRTAAAAPVEHAPVTLGSSPAPSSQTSPASGGRGGR